ncbi:hypothetical protein MMC06_005001 [Schaereria dolodes]|nr:hypothetical protein [Schaereria dolodes]
MGAAQSSQDSRKIKFCSATWEATVLVTRDNQIFTSGNGEKGELGQGADVTRGQTSNEALAFSKLLLKDVEIIDLASSVSHTVVVLSNGDVYGWGNGRKGQLGEPASIVWEPRKIQGIHFNAVRAVCGREFTVIVGNTKEGRYIILGSDKYGIKTMAPPTLSHWKDLGASWGSVFALLVSGKIISWGRNDHGQLVHKDFPSIDRMAVGSEHVLALTQDRRVLAWGWGEHGNCGLQINGKGDAKNGWNEISIPVGEQHGEIRGVGAGCATSWIWTKDI